MHACIASSFLLRCLSPLCTTPIALTGIIVSSSSDSHDYYTYYFYYSVTVIVIVIVIVIVTVTVTVTVTANVSVNIDMNASTERCETTGEGGRKRTYVPSAKVKVLVHSQKEKDRFYTRDTTPFLRLFHLITRIKTD